MELRVENLIEPFPVNIAITSNRKMTTKCLICGYTSRKHGQVQQHIRNSTDPKHVVYDLSLRRCGACGGEFNTIHGRIAHENSLPCTTLSQAAKLLMFLCTLNTDNIPEILFWRLWNTRKWWAQFKDCIQCLESLGFVESREGALGRREFSIKAAIRESVTRANHDQDWLQWICLIVICHTFPRTREEIGLVFLIQNI